MNREKFHNELAMRLGYERIVNDKRIMISVDESDDPLVTLKVQGHDVIKFKASGNTADVDLETIPEMKDEIKVISDAVHEAYMRSTSDIFTLLQW